ncbi:unnamed protein product [Clonostachys rosea f. rosea IK726]|uniref:Major facilitator superfamily (MFS) profile domain-containing protein n=3 Tax=Bionectria ochroleuca TaxID=29856 RepID=A0A0B7JIK0_BIOOC|nr:unnamed protein product [Clonostachys rosea f. rosea IK726]
MDGKIPEVSTESDKQQEIRVENALRPEHIATPRHDAEREAAETRLRHKIDRYVAPNIAIIYLLCFLDRINIGNARISTLEEDLDMHGYDYNKLLAVFYVAYIVAEMPCTFACKLIGPGWFLPGATAAFGLLTLCMAFVQSLGAAYAVRFLLGIAEAGVLPGIAYYLSRWYRRSELTFRVAVCMVMAPLSGAFGGLLASGLLSLESVGSLRTWRIIFLVEGIITFGLGVIAFFTMTDSPQSAKWLTEEERELAMTRLKVERQGTIELVDKWNLKKLKLGVLSPSTLTTFFNFLLIGVIVQSFSIFLPTIVRTIYPNESIITQQLRSAPPYILGAFFAISLPWLSSRIDRRQIFLIAGSPFIIAGYSMFLGTNSSQSMVRYAGTFLIAMGSFNQGTFNNAQAAANCRSDSSRNVAIGLANLGSNVGGLVATWTYLPSGAPNFYLGNGICVGCGSGILLLSIGLLLFMKWDNARRERRDAAAELSGLSEQSIDDLEWKHPEFRWRP